MVVTAWCPQQLWVLGQVSLKTMLGVRVMLVAWGCMALRGISQVGVAAVARAVPGVGLLQRCTVQLLLHLPWGCDRAADVENGIATWGAGPCHGMSWCAVS